MAEGQEEPHRKEVLDTYFEIFKHTTSLNLTAIAAAVVASQAFDWSKQLIVVLAILLGISLLFGLVGMVYVLYTRATGRPLTDKCAKASSPASNLRVALVLSLGVLAATVYVTSFGLALFK